MLQHVACCTSSSDVCCTSVKKAKLRVWQSWSWRYCAIPHLGGRSFSTCFLVVQRSFVVPKVPVLCELPDAKLFMSCSKMEVSGLTRISPASVATFRAVNGFASRSCKLLLGKELHWRFWNAIGCDWYLKAWSAMCRHVQATLWPHVTTASVRLRRSFPRLDSGRKTERVCLAAFDQPIFLAGILSCNGMLSSTGSAFSDSLLFIFKSSSFWNKPLKAWLGHKST